MFLPTDNTKQAFYNYESTVLQCSFYNYAITNGVNAFLFWNNTEPYQFVSNYNLQQRNYVCHTRTTNYDYNNCQFNCTVLLHGEVDAVNLDYDIYKKDWN